MVYIWRFILDYNLVYNTSMRTFETKDPKPGGNVVKRYLVLSRPQAKGNKDIIYAIPESLIFNFHVGYYNSIS